MNKKRCAICGGWLSYREIGRIRVFGDSNEPVKYHSICDGCSLIIKNEVHKTSKHDMDYFQMNVERVKDSSFR